MESGSGTTPLGESSLKLLMLLSTATNFDTLHHGIKADFSQSRFCIVRSCSLTAEAKKISVNMTIAVKSSEYGK
jgi:hypothetical protein